MSINIIDGFYLGNSVPIDSRFVVSNITDRDAIQYKYDGLKVFVLSNRTTYIWNQGTTTWDTSGSTTGSGTANYLTQWVTNTSLGSSIVYATASTGRVGINDNSPLTTLSLKDIISGSLPLSMNIRYINGTVDSAVVGYNWYYNGSDLVSTTAKSSTKIEIGSAGGLQVQTRTAGSAATFNTVLELNNLSGYNFLRGIDKGTFISGSVSFGSGTTPTMSPQLVNVNGSFRTNSSSFNNVKGVRQTTTTYTLLDTDHEVVFASTTNFQVNLPQASIDNLGRIIELSNNSENYIFTLSSTTSILGLDNNTFSGFIGSKEKVKLVVVSIPGNFFTYQWKITEIITPSSSIYSTLASEPWKLIGATGTMVNGQPIPSFITANSTNRGGGYQPLRLRKINSKYVHLQGNLLLANLNTISLPDMLLIALPTGYRPSLRLEFPAIFQDSSNQCYKGLLQIDNSTGLVVAVPGNGEIVGTVTWRLAIDVMIPLD